MSCLRVCSTSGRIWVRRSLLVPSEKVVGKYLSDLSSDERELASIPLAQQGLQPCSRTLGEQPTLWESMLHSGMLTMSPDHERIDELLDDERWFRALPGRSSMPAWAVRPSRFETYLWSDVLAGTATQLGFERPDAKRAPIRAAGQRFSRILLGGTVRHPRTLMKGTTRRSEDAVNVLNKHLG